MKFKKITLLLFLFIAVGFTSCKSHDDKDKQIKEDIEKILVPGITVTVERGVAKIKGEFETEEMHIRVLQDAKKVKHVKEVLDDAITQRVVTPAPADTFEQKIDAILVSYPLVTATITDGTVTLNGTVKRSELPDLMKKINEAQPKKVENLLKIIN